MHSLAAIKKDGIDSSFMTSQNVIDVQKVLDEVQRTISAKLPRRLPKDAFSNRPIGCSDSSWAEETKNKETFYWNPRKDYFLDEVDPRRIRFDSHLDYNTKTDTYGRVTFNINQVHWRFRRLLIANQMHRCCFTCWKYVHEGHALICRFAFPWLPTPATEINRPRIEKIETRRHGYEFVHSLVEITAI